MQVAKWGNSLAVRLPSAVVEALELREGDQIEIRIAGAREFEVRRDRTREKAIERLRRLRLNWRGAREGRTSRSAFLPRRMFEKRPQTE